MLVVDILPRRESELAAAPFDLEIERPKYLTLSEETDLARKALARDPSSVALRRRLARFLLALDEMDDALALLTAIVAEGAGDFAVHILLATALLARETLPDTRQAKVHAKQAFALAPTDRAKAQALALLAKSDIRVGQDDDGRRSLTAALALYPYDFDAYKRLEALEGRTGAPDAALRLSDRMLDLGVAHSQVLVSRGLGLARMRRFEEARAMFGFDRFVSERVLSTPDGWPDLDAFNADLAHELLHHPALRFERYGVASTKSWRVDTPATSRSRCTLALQRSIFLDVRRYVENLPNDEHPWCRARPAKAMLHNWSVITGSEGYEEWHVHQNGWMSGVYYVDVPEHVCHGSDKRGCLAFGIPPERVGETNAAEYGETLIRPFSGLLLLFPSHLFHRTFPHGRENRRRVCVAFDIIPM